MKRGDAAGQAVRARVETLCTVTGEVVERSGKAVEDEVPGCGFAVEDLWTRMRGGRTLGQASLTTASLPSARPNPTVAC